MQRRALLAAAGTGAWLVPWAAAAQAVGGPSALERIKSRVRLVVRLYNDMPPFHQVGAGIAAQRAKARTKGLGC